MRQANRTGGGVVTAAGNRLVFDGVYRYAYDAEGNRTATRTSSGMWAMLRWTGSIRVV
jgi:hypothetical protein